MILGKNMSGHVGDGFELPDSQGRGHQTGCWRWLDPLSWSFDKFYIGKMWDDDGSWALHVAIFGPASLEDQCECSPTSHTFFPPGKTQYHHNPVLGDHPSTRPLGKGVLVCDLQLNQNHGRICGWTMIRTYIYPDVSLCIYIDIDILILLPI